MYSEDFADFILEYLEWEDAPAIMNVGLGHDYTITELYTAVADVLGYTGEFRYDRSKPSGVKEKRVDISNQIAMGWNTRYTLAEGIEETYKYYLEEVL